MHRLDGGHSHQEGEEAVTWISYSSCGIGSWHSLEASTAAKDAATSASNVLQVEMFSGVAE